MCRVTAQDLERVRNEVGSKADVICLTFEDFGKESDKDFGFQKGKFFTGSMYKVSQSDVYAPLFGRKSLSSGFGLGSLISDKSGKLAESKARGVTGNLAGDGMQLGGVFVCLPGGEVVLDRRQGFFGDDPSVEELLTAIETACSGGGGK